jgi:ABC-type bacteriocin/lantibiotic exporter with double-glycine peptidase domain
LRDGELTRESFAWLVGSFCRLNRIPFEASLLLQRFPAPHSFGQFREALQSLSFKVGDGQLARASLPCIGFLKAGEPALLCKVDDEAVLYFRPGSAASETAPVASFERDVVLVRHDAPALEGEGAEPASAFGFGWFWKELARHKSICSR